MNQYLDKEFQETTDSFFEELNCYLSSYRDSLKQAQTDQQLGTRLDALESRIRQLEVRVAANEDLDRIVTAWAAGQTYNKREHPNFAT